MDLADWADKQVEALSKGMSQKVQFIATVIARPKLILLDEPFSGFDPVNAEVLRDAILTLKKERDGHLFDTRHGRSRADVRLHLHDLQGPQVLDGTLDEIRDRYGEDTLRVRLDGHDGTLEGLPGGRA